VVIEERRSDAEAAKAEREVAWTHYADVLIARRRLLYLGAAVALAVMAALLILPRSYSCLATLSLPTLEQPAAARSGETPGIPVVSYKKLERSLGDEEVLAEAFVGKLDRAQVKVLRRSIGSTVSPVATSGRDEILRIDAKTDRVAAVTLAYDDRPPERALEIVSTIGDLVRRIVLANIALEALDELRVKAHTAAPMAHRAEAEFAATNESLDREIHELERLASHSPVVGPTGREVVDTANGGHRYLAPSLQVFGLKALKAENDHRIRLLQREQRIALISVDLLRRVDERIAKERSAGRALPDVRRILSEESSSLDATSADATAVRIQFEEIGARLDAYKASMRFIQAPTVQRHGRATTAIISGTIVIVCFGLLALGQHTWLRQHPAP
jgi:hypothetical protein